MIQPAPSGRPEPVFEHPWHAQVFALTVHLNETGMFTWPDWTRRFSQALARNGLTRDLNGGDDYFNAWLDTLETLLTETGQADPQEVSAATRAWEKAFLTTPHGKPVTPKP